MFCKGCGAKIRESAKFCRGCGKSVTPIAPLPPVNFYPSKQLSETSSVLTNSSMPTKKSEELPIKALAKSLFLGTLVFGVLISIFRYFCIAGLCGLGFLISWPLSAIAESIGAKRDKP